MNIQLTRILPYLCNSHIRNRSYCIVQFSRSINRTLSQSFLVTQRVPKTVYTHSYLLAANLHTSCCKYQAVKTPGDLNEGPQEPADSQEPKKKKESGFKKFVNTHWYRIMFLNAVLGTSLLVLSIRDYKEVLQKEKALEHTEAVGEARIGMKDWELMDTEGNKVLKRDLTGKWILLYFGFTHCPDICPEELDKLAAVNDIINLNKTIPDVQVVFITVDPERDTPELIKEYLGEFSNKFLGLTGTLEQVKEAATSYQVYFAKGKVGEDGDYIVDHSIITYLMDPNGKFMEFYTRTAKAIDIANRIEKKMLAYEQ